MAFLRWICVKYIAKKRKYKERKTINQYWRDFKMLFLRMNDSRPVVMGNDAQEYITAGDPSKVLIITFCIS